MYSPRNDACIVFLVIRLIATEQKKFFFFQLFRNVSDQIISDVAISVHFIKFPFVEVSKLHTQKGQAETRTYSEYREVFEKQAAKQAAGY